MIKLSLNSINLIKYTSQKTSFKAINPVSIKKDSFEAGENAQYTRALAKLQDITKEEYETLTENEKNILRAKLEDSNALGLPNNQNIKEQVRLHQKAATEIKKAFDTQYGEGNYVVIPIGQSLSSIGKMLSIKIGNENVKNIPMSCMMTFYASGRGFESYKSRIEKFIHTKHFEDYKKYLEQSGLSKDEINKSNKHYILMDFKSSGDSLKAAYMVLTSDYLLGNDKRNISYAYICDLGSTFKNGGHYGDIANSEYKKYSYVNKMDFNEESYDINIAKDYKSNENTDLKKLFGFALLDDEYTKEQDILYKTLEFKKNQSIPFQDRKVYLSPRRQYMQDIYTDSIEIAKLKTRLEKINTKLKKKQSLFGDDIDKENRILECSLEEQIKKKFPLEYDYFLNQKRFEEISEGLSNEDIELAKPHIYKPFPGLEKQSPIYKLLDFKKNYFEQIPKAKNKAFYDTNLVYLQEAYNKLDKAEADIRKHRNTADLIKELEISGVSSHIKEVTEFHNDFHPNLQKILSDINKKLPFGIEDVYLKKIDKIYKNGINTEGKRAEGFKKEFEKKLNNIQPCLNQSALQEIVNEQKETLKRAYDMMLPF